ncbi:NAD+ synthase [Candidatus Fukatsuia anoeciicola]|uniref:NAD+ synthase n=1 Tax=Candidatus Fukatsuia anoeciicola TaxID=2994492 RepID=UPI003463E207
MSKSLSIVLAQLNWMVGDIEGNTERMLQIVAQQQGKANLVMFSELALCGYPPEDLLLRNDFYQRCIDQLLLLQQASLQISIIVGHPWREGKELYNALSIFSAGKLLDRYFKQLLPNYGVFDEKRYFTPGNNSCVIKLKDYHLGMLICEDVWSSVLVDAAKAAGAEILLSINASPYHREKSYIRNQLLVRHCQRTKLPLVYLNQVGGQDDLIFDGCSKVFNAQGKITHRLAAFAEQITLCQLTDLNIIPMQKLAVSYVIKPFAKEYQALVMAASDYVNKNGFKGALLGLSGGIDSALTLAIIVDALGKEKVHGIMMPSRYTSILSIKYAQQQAKIQGIKFNILSIEPIFNTFMAQLAPLFINKQVDITEENLQARCRSVLLMALSNKFGSIVITTSNKSELAVGYSTLYGDMAGGFDVLKDVSKTLVFKLAKYRNSFGKIKVIPQEIIDRQPSAELAPKQLDLDKLPPYDILDNILEGYIERDESIVDLIARDTKGCYDETIIRNVIRLVDTNEHKRRQSAIGPRITNRDLGKDRRYPITCSFGRKNW